MRYSPHEYQRFVIDYIKKNPIAAVFLDMGLGKTSITLTALNDLLFDSFDVHRVLVVAPLRVARNTWSSEIRKWEHLIKNGQMRFKLNCKNISMKQTLINVLWQSHQR